MSVAVTGSRTQLWLESLGDWSWPGRVAGAAAEVLPPPWVPALPPRFEPVATTSASAMPVPWQRRRAIPRSLGLGILLSALAAACVAVALNGPLTLERVIGFGGASSTSSAQPAPRATTASAGSLVASLPALVSVSHDRAGSSIDKAAYTSATVHGRGAFLVYLPAGYATTTQHYPVLYLLHGNDQPASAFLQIGLQAELDQLIARHVIPPLIAVMIQGGRGANNWLDWGVHRYETYVLEVQEMVDRMLPTIAARDARAVAGDSMGGYGAMNLALRHLDRFAVVESWLGFFDGLNGYLQADRPLLSRMGLRAFVYGAASDHIAGPSENAPFAAALRAAGARAKGVVYSGGHSLETLEAHLPSMLAFAGRALAPAAQSWPASQ